MKTHTSFAALCGTVFCLFMLGFSALAQPPVTGGPQPANNPANVTPIDGGISMLLASGAAYGLKRLRRRA